MIKLIRTLSAKTEDQVRKQLLTELIQDGELNAQNQERLIAKYVVPFVVNKTKYLSITNFIKTIAVGMLLFATWGIITKIVKKTWRLFASIPLYVYLFLAFTVSVTGLVAPKTYSKSQSDWVAITCTFTTLMVVGATFGAYNTQLEPILKKIFRLGIPRELIANFWLIVYFASIALYYQSQIIGFFAIVSLSSLTSFSLIYVPGTLFLHFKNEMLPIVVIAHSLELLIYMGLKLTNNFPEAFSVFKFGVEYYASIALGTGLLVGASPFYSHMKYTVPYALFFIILTAGFLAVHFLGGIKVPGSVLTCFCFLTILEWFGYIGFRGGMIVGCIVSAAGLFGAARLIEKHSDFILAK
ncbi:Conserved_hypothetical protein [Hexamita inflata]|uniref:Uncharacterized protein n=1 Tax=Hexamita inflata TaxID=28002 RepID=A0AA86P8F9_9EUKA|nr:Conserved hypothetical protein [Hexamita inflata]